MYTETETSYGALEVFAQSSFELAPHFVSADFVVTASGLRADFVTADEARALGAEAGGELLRIVDWCENFLGKPHADVGRSGNVCPFVPEALMRGSLKFASVALRARGAEAVPEIEEMVDACREHFVGGEAGAGKMDIFGSMVLIFPDVTAEEAPLVLDPSQRKLKPSFVREGLMLGEFHPFNATPGLRNAQFRPLRSPVPLLAIRHMVESDVDFLMAPNDPPATRIKSLRAYLKFLGPSLSMASQAKAKEGLRLAEAQALRV
jgi:hypothetical protein